MKLNSFGGYYMIQVVGSEKYLGNLKSFDANIIDNGRDLGKFNITFKRCFDGIYTYYSAKKI